MDRIVNCEDAEAVITVIPGTRNGWLGPCGPGPVHVEISRNNYTAFLSPAHASLHQQHALYQMTIKPAAQINSLAAQHAQADAHACT